MPEPGSNDPKPDSSRPVVPAQPSVRPPAPKEEPSFEGLISQLFASNKGDGKRRNKQGGEMGLLDHLEELRMTIIKCVMALWIGIMVVGLFFYKFFDLLRLPLIWGLGDNAAVEVLRTKGPMEIFTLIIQVIVFGGFLLALPFVAYFIIRFVVPGLTLREKSILRPALLSALALFILGALGCFRIMLPAGIKFAYFLNVKMGIQPNWFAGDYYSLVVWSTLGMGVLFEFPLVLAILQMLGIVETGTLRRYWRQALVVIMVLASVVAPSPDPLSMLAIATPMALLYAGSLVVGARLRRQYLAKQAQREAEEQAAGL
jgi:sec-independent protein translocase protein TatC